MSASEIVNKVWNYAHVLRDDGVGYGDYVEQITYLIFFKMADERAALTPAPSPQPSPKGRGSNEVPDEYSWAKLVKLDGDDLELQYRHTLESLGKEGGMLGTIFRKGSYSRGVLFHLFGEFWRTTYSFEYRYLSEGVKT